MLWPGEKRTAEALRAAQGEDVPGNWFTVRDFTSDDGMLRRPFANYPHDWRAIQICSGLLAERLRDTHGLHGTGAALRDRSDAERHALRMQIRDEALAWFSRAGADSPFAAVPQTESDRFWSWLEAYPWLVRVRDHGSGDVVDRGLAHRVAGGGGADTCRCRSPRPQPACVGRAV